MLELDSLVLDLMFPAGVLPDEDTLVEAAGGEEVLATRQLFDPDTNDPRIELQLFPSIPFRRRGERRLLIIDPSVAPMRADPHGDPVVPLDVRAEKERLIELVSKCGARVGRIFALGSWGDAVLVARAARDLRALSLLSWALDPTVDQEGRKRAAPLNQAELEAKLLSYDKRLEELDERAILSSIGPAKFERRGELLVLDVLGSDGSWDLRHSHAMEIALASIDRFSRVLGAPYTAAPSPSSRPANDSRPAPTKAAPSPAPAAKPGSPLQTTERNGRLVLLFPKDRWDLDVAAALGKRDWEAVLRSSDPITGSMRDRMRNEGAGFVAPLEFLSEVFVDGKPLSRQRFDEGAAGINGDLRSLSVHCPRYGAATLVDSRARGRFVTSESDADAALIALMPG